MAARSVSVSFTNKSDVALILAQTDLPHGIWTTQPPQRIDPGQTVGWESESQGFATGTEGTAWYDIDGLQGVPGTRTKWHWDNPFVGSNSYDEFAPEVFKAMRGPGGGGDDAAIGWTFDDASTTGDGIPDDWKTNGVTIDPGDGSGPQFIDLKAMGADVNKPDVFVQVDWMADKTHSHALTPAAIKMVVDAFANSPFISRSGSIGINLHVDAGPNSIMNFATNQTWGALSRARQLGEVPQLGTGTLDGNNSLTSYDWTEFDKIKNQPGGFTSSGRTKIFRYCICAHELATGGNSGVARAAPGSDFIVSLGPFLPVTDIQMAGTFMHELGHCLGLGHGGGDGVNNKPNYVSVMNYLWQMSGVTRNGSANIIDYSNAELRALNENALDETVGLGVAAKGVTIAHWLPATAAAPGRFVQVADASRPIDWNGDGDTADTSVAIDANNDGGDGNLAPFDDWKHIKLRGGAIGAGGGYVPPQTSSIVEITPQQQQLILPPDTTPPQTTASVWPPPNAAGWNRTRVEVTFTATDDASGVACTFASLDAGGHVAMTGPLGITAEGVHAVDYHSVDRSQNIEPSEHLDVRIDETAPEVVISYDPVADDIVVTGRDGLSGVDPGTFAPSAVTPTTWTDFGSDVARLRVYRVRDHADNVTTLTMKVRCSPREWEASVLSIDYDDARHRRRKHRGEDGSRNGRPSGDHDRNTMIFERLVGRDAGETLLGVEQVVSIGEGDARTTVRARYDVLDDLTLLAHETGSSCCDAAAAALETDVRGLVTLHVATHAGHLKVDE